MTKHKVKMTVNLQNLFKQIAREIPIGMVIGLNITLGCLKRIAERTIEIKDEKILEELKTLCIIEEAT